MVRAIILVKSPKKLIAVKLRKLTTVANSFPTSGLQIKFKKLVEWNELKLWLKFNKKRSPPFPS